MLDARGSARAVCSAPGTERGEYRAQGKARTAHSAQGSAHTVWGAASACLCGFQGRGALKATRQE